MRLLNSLTSGRNFKYQNGRPRGSQGSPCAPFIIKIDYISNFFTYSIVLLKMLYGLPEQIGTNQIGN